VCCFFQANATGTDTLAAFERYHEKWQNLYNDVHEQNDEEWLEFLAAD
jgi:hypothetical protein